MAGDWLKFEVDLPEKPEVWQIAGLLKIDPDAVVGKLMKVWRWFDKHTESGNASGVTYPLLDSLVGVTGFAEAMVFAGWLEQRGRDLCLPNFDRHNGKTAKDRALTAKRVAKLRNAPDVTSPLAKEEKRREEEKKKPARKAARISLDDFFSLCDAEGVLPIPEDDPIYAYAERIGLPAEFIPLAWGWFKRKRKDARQAGIVGWRAHFRDAVEANWPGYWYAMADGGYALTTAGKQAQRAAT